MRWRWRVCVLGCVVGGYLSVITAISLLHLASNDGSKGGNEVKGNSQVPVRGMWGWSNAHVGGRGSRLPWCKEMKFVEPSGPNTALASFPGSGNTWVRYLLQQVAGFYTGSVYKDFALMKNGFPAESISNGSVVLVKTHEFGAEVRHTFSRAVLLIRDPYQSIQAEFNRQSGGHIGHAQPDKYSRDSGRYWTTFAQNKALTWTNTNLDWLKFNGPLHVIFYEDLLDNLAEEMRRLIEFLNLEVNDQGFECMMKHRDGIYKRRRRNLNFDPYTQPLRKLIDYCKKLVDKAVREFLAGNEMESVISSMNMTMLNSISKTQKGQVSEIRLAR